MPGPGEGVRNRDISGNMMNIHPIVSIEHPFDQNDFATWTGITKRIGDNVQIVGDDLLVTNPKRVQLCIEEKICNSMLLKVIQNGSVTEFIEASNTCQQAGWGVMVSHRSGETEDNFIGDLVCGLATDAVIAPVYSRQIFNTHLKRGEHSGFTAGYPGSALAANNPFTEAVFTDSASHLIGQECVARIIHMIARKSIDLFIIIVINTGELVCANYKLKLQSASSELHYNSDRKLAIFPAFISNNNHI